MSSSGGDPFSEVTGAFTDIASGNIGRGLAKFAAFATDPTGALYTLDNNGKLKKGWLAHAGDEGLGEVTGRNVQREMMHKQEKALADQQAQEAQQQADELKKKQMQDTQTSLSAQSLVNPTSATYNQKLAALQNNSKLGGQTDFLGL